MTCEIISSSGRDGNAVLLSGNILFDCGVPWRKLKSCARQIRFLFLTHVHGDHFNIQTIQRLWKMNPRVRFVCSCNVLPDLVSRAHVPLDRIILIRPEDGEKTFQEWESGVSITARSFHLLHDVPNVGWLVTVSGGSEPGSALYATDTHHVPISAPGLDLYMVEANYTQEDMDRRIAEKSETGAFSYEGRVIQSHMSMETAVQWLAENADPYKSKIVFLHGHTEKGKERPEETEGACTPCTQ